MSELKFSVHGVEVIKNFFKKKDCEKLYKKSNVYDVIIVINYNLKPIIKNRGSAIFLHISTKQYSPTKGCIAVSKKDMFLLLSFIEKRTKIIIS